LEVGARLAALDAEDEVHPLTGCVVAATEAVVGGGITEASSVLLGVRTALFHLWSFLEQTLGDNPELADRFGVDVAADNFAGLRAGIESAVGALHALIGERVGFHVMGAVFAGCLIEGTEFVDHFLVGLVERCLAGTHIGCKLAFHRFCVRTAVSLVHLTY
jgi:hypothetical protein